MAPLLTSEGPLHKRNLELLSSLALSTVLPAGRQRACSLEQDLGRVYPVVLLSQARPEEAKGLELVGKFLQTLQGAVQEKAEELFGFLEKAAAGKKKPRRVLRRQPLSPLRAHNFAAIIPGDGVAEQVITTGIFNFLNIYNTLLIGRLILTWFPNPPEVIAGPLSTICDPYLNLFRGIIPPIGGSIDLSPVLAFLALNVFTNAASALPAELPDATEYEGSVPEQVQMQITPETKPKELTWRQRAGLLKGFKIRD